MAELGKKVSRSASKFNAVDLITCVVFGALVRVLWLVFKTVGVIFPFNHSFMQMFSAFCVSACIAVVKKKNAAFYYTVAWCSINFFLQGESPHYWLLVILLPIIPDMYMSVRSKSFSNPDDVYHSTKDVIVFTYIYNIIYWIFVFISIKYITKMPVPTGLMFLAWGLALILTGVGSYIGLTVGKRVNALIQ